MWKTSCGWTFGLSNTTSVAQLPVKSSSICSAAFVPKRPKTEPLSGPHRARSRPLAPRVPDPVPFFPLLCYVGAKWSPRPALLELACQRSSRKKGRLAACGRERRAAVWTSQA